MSETFVPSRALDPVNSPYQNLLTNGGFEQWNGGTLFTNPPDQQNAADGWAVRVVGVTAYTISQEATTIDNGAYSMKVNITNAGSGTRLRVGQTPITSNNSASLNGKQLSLSMRVKSNVAGVCVMAFWSGGTILSTAHTGDNTWQTLSVKFTPGGVGLSVHVGFDSTAGGAAPANGIFYVDSAMLMLGATIPTFEPDHAEVELLKTGYSSIVQGNTRNILINGGFEIWNRGDICVNPQPSGYMSVTDGWVAEATTTSSIPTVTYGQETVNFDPLTGRNALYISVTSAGSGTTQAGIIQTTYGNSFRNRTVSYAMRVKTTLAGFKLQITDLNTTKYSNAHSGGGGWETLSVTLSVYALANYLCFRAGWYDVNVPGTGVVYVDNAIANIGPVSIPYVSESQDNDSMRSYSFYTQYGHGVDNLADNGGFLWWQRGTTFSNPANGAETADRWTNQYNTATVQPTFTISRLGTAYPDPQSPYAMRFQCTVVGTGVLNDARFAIQYFDTAASHRSKPITFSAYVRSNSNGCGILLQGAASSPSIYRSAYHPGDGNWHLLTVTTFIDDSTSTVAFGIFAPNAVCYVDATAVMVVQNASPAPYQPVAPYQDLIRCQRYYEVSSPIFETVEPISRNAGVNYCAYFSIPFRVTKVATPTVTLSSLSVVLLHLATTGNSSSSDTANWTAGKGVGVNGFYVGLTRTGDQTTYPLASIEFNWVAEVT